MDEIVASWEVEEGDTMREGWVLLKIPRGDIDGVGEVMMMFIPRGWNQNFLELELQISTPRSLKKPVQFPR